MIGTKVPRFLSPVMLLTGLLQAPGSPTAAADLQPVLVWMDSLRGNETEELRWPQAVAAGPGEIVVADAFGPKLLVFRRVGSSWQLLRSIDLRGQPIAITYDGSNYLLSVRGEPGLVSFQGPDLLQGRKRLPSGVLPGPIDAIAEDQTLVYDLEGQRILLLDDGGKISREVPVSGGVTAVAATPEGGFMVTVAEEGIVRVFDGNWESTSTWSLPATGNTKAWPVDIAVSSGGDVLVLDRHGARIVVFDAAGNIKGQGARKGWEPGLLLFPAGIARSVDGEILVADEGNGRLQIFRNIR